MSYSKGLFLQKEPDRRALRDKTRDAFFADYGAARLKDPMRVDADPFVQQSKVMELIAIANRTHAGDRSGLAMLERELLSSAFGIPVLPVGLPNQLTLAQISPEGMQRSNFDMRWAGWFDE